MSRSKSDDELAKILEDFCDKIIQLNRQTREYLSKYSIEQKQNAKKITSLQEALTNFEAGDDTGESRFLPATGYEFYSVMKDAENAHSLVKMHVNAQFLYMFTLFEKFLSETVKASVRKHKNIRERYKERFAEFAKQQHSKYNDDRYIDMLTDLKKLLENYDELPNPLRVLCDIFAIKTNDEVFRRHWRRYIEARERRNLLTHRGDFLDRRYYYSIKKGLGKYGQQVDKFLNDEILKEHEEKIDFSEIDKKEISADVIPAYFNQVTLTLLYIANIVHVSAFKKSKKYYKIEGSFLLNPCHNLMLYSYDKDDINFAFIVSEIWFYYIEHIFGGYVNDWSLIERVNFCLLLKFVTGCVHQLAEENNSNNEERQDKLPIVDFESILSKCDAEHDDLRELALAHFRKDKKNLIKYSKKIKLNRYAFDNWFLFREWQSDADVKAFFENVAGGKS